MEWFVYKRRVPQDLQGGYAAPFEVSQKSNNLFISLSEIWCILILYRIKRRSYEHFIFFDTEK